MKLMYLKSALNCDSFDVPIGTKIPFFRDLVTIEPGRSLLQFVTTNCLIMVKICNLLPLPGSCWGLIRPQKPSYSVFLLCRAKWLFQNFDPLTLEKN